MEEISKKKIAEIGKRISEKVVEEIADELNTLNITNIQDFDETAKTFKAITEEVVSNLSGGTEN